MSQQDLVKISNHFCQKNSSNWRDILCLFATFLGHLVYISKLSVTRNRLNNATNFLKLQQRIWTKKLCRFSLPKNSNGSWNQKRPLPSSYYAIAIILHSIAVARNKKQSSSSGLSRKTGCYPDIDQRLCNCRELSISAQYSRIASPPALGMYKDIWLQLANFR